MSEFLEVQILREAIESRIEPVVCGDPHAVLTVDVDLVSVIVRQATINRVIAPEGI